MRHSLQTKGESVCSLLTCDVHFKKRNAGMHENFGNSRRSFKNKAPLGGREVLQIACLFILEERFRNDDHRMALSSRIVSEVVLFPVTHTLVSVLQNIAPS